MKILVIRRDNIGDLVCTTPLLTCIATQLPGAVVDILVNEYNYQVLEGNTDIRKTWIYRKVKHRRSGESVFSVWFSALSLFREIRKEKYDVAIVASPGFQIPAIRLAKFSGARSILGYMHNGYGLVCGLPAELASHGHEVEATLRLASLLGLEVTKVPELKVIPNALLKEKYNAKFGEFSGHSVAIHISARKKSQRWSADKFISLAKKLFERHRVRVFLFWSPGEIDDPLHPGDDIKSKQILDECSLIPVIPVPTNNLKELIAALSLADSYIGSDGGAMHLAAGVGLPIVAMFGSSDVERWHPWSESAVCLQNSTHSVDDLSVNQVLDAWECLNEGRH